jgi:hypothetical protein
MTDEIGNAFDVLADTADDTNKRQQREDAARGGIIDGRTRKRARRGRAEQIAMKTSPQKREQLQRLALRMGVTFVEAFEAALDALEEKLDQPEIAPAGRGRA